jgi:predicted nucleotidyltransferase
MEAQSTVKTQRKEAADRLLAHLQKIVPPILARYPVDAAYVYGSVAQGTVLPSSDVDIGLLLSASLSPYEQLKLDLAIQGDIEAEGNLPVVDVRTINQAPLMVRGRIVQQGILLYEKDRMARIAFEVATRKRYFDFAPVAHRLRDAFLKHVREEGLLRGRPRHPELDSE